MQSNFTAENVVSSLQTLLADTAERAKMLDGLARVRERLRSAAGDPPQPAAERAAEAVLAALS
jgi:lipid A disaccharide synthetase